MTETLFKVDRDTLVPDGYLIVRKVADVYVTGVGQVLRRVHSQEECKDRPSCVIHAPSPHPMRGFPTNWRPDRGLMERICTHGVGHPDPDHVAYIRTFMTPSRLRVTMTHGCCGCCWGSYLDVEEPSAEEVFKKIVWSLIDLGTFPSAQTIQEALGQARPGNLNGRQTTWRREVLEEAGYTKGSNGRWTR